jgi:diguanylate cyclase (GGDEF)-like protein
MSLAEFIDRRSKSVLFLFGLLVVFLIGYIDYLTGKEITVTIFYMLPITFVTWYVGAGSGIFISVIAALTWYFADSVGIHRYSLRLIDDWNELVRVGFFFIVVFILSRLKAAYENEKLLARVDYLTGAYNSRAFYDLAQVEVERAVRYQHPLTLAYIDVDNFKAVNDRLGHGAGDQLLKSLVEQMKKNVRPFDIIARIGGDEFVVLFPEAGADSAGVMLERFAHEIGDVMEENDSPVTFSMGAVTFINPTDSVAGMIKKADSLMYQAKAGGKNSIRHEVLDQSPKLAE